MYGNASITIERGEERSCMELSYPLVTERPVETTETLPPRSVWVAVIVAVHSDSVEAVIVTVPPAQSPVPMTPSTDEESVTVDPVTHESVKSGVVSLVALSVEEVPVSVPAVISGVPVAASAVVSIVTERPVDTGEIFPPTSVCLPVIVAVHSDNVEAVIVTVPPAQSPVPMTPSTDEESVTVDPVTQPKVKSGVVLAVLLSESEGPVSVPAVISGASVAASAVVSTIKTRTGAESALTFPAGSVW
jgi:hypothetical protein